MRNVVAALAVLAVTGCASVQAHTEDGKRYTCIPNDAMDRGPFQPETPAGQKLTVHTLPASEAPAEVVAEK